MVKKLISMLIVLSMIFASVPAALAEEFIRTSDFDTSAESTDENEYTEAAEVTADGDVCPETEATADDDVRFEAEAMLQKNADENTADETVKVEKDSVRRTDYVSETDRTENPEAVEKKQDPDEENDTTETGASELETEDKVEVGKENAGESIDSEKQTEATEKPVETAESEASETVAETVKPEEEETDGTSRVNREKKNTEMSEEKTENSESVTAENIPENEVEVPETDFNQTVIVDGIRIRAEACIGVFPKGAVLTARKATKKENRRAEGCVEKIREEDKTVASCYVFDISVLDTNGNELQPDCGKGSVQISFTVEDIDGNLDADIYHIGEDGNAENLNAEERDDTITAETYSFSLYVVEFSYGELAYTLMGNESIELSSILESLEIAGEVTSAVSGAPELFRVEQKDSVWIVSALSAFSTEETLTVTVGGIDYDLKLTAEWTPVTYRITYYGNGADTGVMKPQSMTYDSEAVLTENTFCRDGYIFKGWALSADGEMVYANGAKVKNLTDLEGAEIGLYAVWEAETWVVVIPASFEMTVGEEEKTVTAKNVALEKGRVLKVRISSPNYCDGWCMKYGNDVIQYSIGRNGFDLESGDIILGITAEEASVSGTVSENLLFTMTENAAQSAKYADTYKDTLTFTVTAEDAA